MRRVLASPLIRAVQGRLPFSYSKRRHSRPRSTQHTSTQTQRNGEPSRATLAAFACGRGPHRNCPGRGLRAEAACVGTPGFVWG